jgi:hypothetical protein
MTSVIYVIADGDGADLGNQTRHRASDKRPLMVVTIGIGWASPDILADARRRFSRPTPNGGFEQ